MYDFTCRVRRSPNLFMYVCSCLARLHDTSQLTIVRLTSFVWVDYVWVLSWTDVFLFCQTNWLLCYSTYRGRYLFVIRICSVKGKFEIRILYICINVNIFLPLTRSSLLNCGICVTLHSLNFPPILTEFLRNVRKFEILLKLLLTLKSISKESAAVKAALFF